MAALQTLEGLAKENRAGLGALRTRPLLAKGKFFTSSAALSAKLFTAGAAAEEGFAARRARTAKQAESVRSAANALGIDLFPQVNELSHYSNTVTAMKMPAGVTDDKLRGGMKKQGVIISGGQEQLKGKIFRIGTMGGAAATAYPALGLDQLQS